MFSFAQIELEHPVGFIPTQHKMTIEVNFISEKIDIWSSPTHNSIIELSNSNQHLCALALWRSYPRSVFILVVYKVLYNTVPKNIRVSKKVLTSFFEKINNYRTRNIISRGLYIFTPLFSAVCITDNLCAKQGNSSIFEPKIRGL